MRVTLSILVYLSVLFLHADETLTPIVIPENEEWEAMDSSVIFAKRDPFIVEQENEKPEQEVDEFAPQRAARLQEASDAALEAITSGLEGVMVSGESGGYVALGNTYYAVGENLDVIKVNGFSVQLIAVGSNQITVAIESDGSDVNMLGARKVIAAELEF